MDVCGCVFTCREGYRNKLGFPNPEHSDDFASDQFTGSPCILNLFQQSTLFVAAVSIVVDYLLELAVGVGRRQYELNYHLCFWIGLDRDML